MDCCTGWKDSLPERGGIRGKMPAEVIPEFLRRFSKNARLGAVLFEFKQDHTWIESMGRPAEMTHKYGDRERAQMVCLDGIAQCSAIDQQRSLILELSHLISTKSVMWPIFSCLVLR